MATTMGRSAATPIRPKKTRRAPLPVEFYRSTLGKKWVMAVTGIILIGFVVTHMIGNLKVYLSREEINLYGEALRDIPGHLLPRTVFLWTIRLVLVAAFVFHIHAAISLARTAKKARPSNYQSPRDYLAANFASRTMRWTGPIVALYVIFHLADLTWGAANPDFVRGDPYNNLVRSFERPVVAIVYILANAALAIHLYHGTWSLFQSLGINNPKYNGARRGLAQGIAALIFVGNVSFPIAVMAGVIETACDNGDPVAECAQDSGAFAE
jgi:succinate dehydrogenase / fumarate reductase, cytochrome b subunit